MGGLERDSDRFDSNLEKVNMLNISFDTSPKSILCLGAHSDDIEIGCGATLLRLIEEYEDVCIKWVVFSGNETRTLETKNSMDLFLQGLKTKDVEFKGFKDGFFPYDGKGIKLVFEELKNRVSPDIIFTHYRHDLHQDHRIISELTWNTFRNHLILEYEIPKYDGDMGSPNLFVHVNKEQCDKKVQFLMAAFESQRNKHWFTKELFQSILRIRGMESCSSSNLAEAFYCRKLCF